RVHHLPSPHGPGVAGSGRRRRPGRRSHARRTVLGRMTQEGPRVVEFAGLPGAGKSRLAGDLVRELRDRGALANATADAIAPEVASMTRLSRKVGLIFERLVAEPGASMSIARAIARGRSTPRDAAHRAVQWTATQ